MAVKGRNGIRVYNPYVPNEVWDLFKKTLRRTLKNSFDGIKLGVTEFFWQGFSYCDEYIRIKDVNQIGVDWERIIQVSEQVANEFGLAIKSVYTDTAHEKFENKIDCLSDIDSLYVSLILINNKRDWTSETLDAFLEAYEKNAKER